MIEEVNMWCDRCNDWRMFLMVDDTYDCKDNGNSTHTETALFECCECEKRYEYTIDYEIINESFVETSIEQDENDNDKKEEKE